MFRVSPPARKPERSHSEYSLSELGQSLIPIIDLLMAWGVEHKEVFEKKYGKG